MQTEEYSTQVVPDHCVTVSSDNVRAPKLRQPMVVALSFRMTNMGNGVDRIERFARVPFDQAVAGAGASGVEPLPQPTPHRIKDAVVQVLGAVGIPAPAMRELLIEGYTSAVSERAFDVIAWMALLV